MTAGIGARVWGALAIVYVVWGSTYLAIRYAVDTMPPLLSAGVRFLAAGLILLAVVVAVRGRAALRMSRAQAATAAVSGVLLLCGGNGLVSVAEQRVDSGLAALLVACIPLWIVVLRAGLGDRPGLATSGGVLLGFLGVALIFLPGDTGDTDLGYAALCVLASLSWAAGSLLVTRRPVPADPLTLTTVEMLAGGLALLVVSPAVGELRGFSVADVSGTSWLAVAYLIVFGSLVAFTAYVWLLGNAPVSLVSTYAYVNPAVAVLLGVLIADERLTGATLGGGLVVLAAIAVVVTAESRRQRRARAAAPAARDGAPVPVPAAAAVGEACRAG
ncbi:MAG TPA: EamA family transporter [Mycobacteriales bacterium]|jgi:drug/metabolite transporter (DMT)-like permease|nr:EamA family transporter [Mycobacteriales bacterium]